jgi:hypothetical protein
MVREETPAALGLPGTAQAYLDRRRTVPGSRLASISRLGSVSVALDEEYCREVAMYYDRAPRQDYGSRVRRRYDQFKRENLDQYAAVLDTGLEIEPWLGAGQPYRDSADLLRRVRRTGLLRVYLTSSGHGPGRSRGWYHPLREPSGVVARGVRLTHNDVFRVVHDVFGHLMFGNSFGPRGEFKATYCHLHMYSDEVHPILFTEQIGQICWFFYGPHLAGPDGNLPGPDDPGYLPPARRPYPEQKVYAFAAEYIDRFHRMFQYRSPDDPPHANG